MLENAIYRVKVDYSKTLVEKQAEAGFARTSNLEILEFLHSVEERTEIADIMLMRLGSKMLCVDIEADVEALGFRTATIPELLQLAIDFPEMQMDCGMIYALGPAPVGMRDIPYINNRIVIPDGPIIHTERPDGSGGSSTQATKFVEARGQGQNMDWGRMLMAGEYVAVVRK